MIKLEKKVRNDLKKFCRKNKLSFDVVIENFNRKMGWFTIDNFTFVNFSYGYDNIKKLMSKSSNWLHVFDDDMYKFLLKSYHEDDFIDFDDKKSLYDKIMSNPILINTFVYYIKEYGRLLYFFMTPDEINNIDNLVDKNYLHTFGYYVIDKNLENDDNGQI